MEDIEEKLKMLRDSCLSCAESSYPGVSLLDASQQRLAKWLNLNLGIQFDEDNRLPTRLCFSCIQDIKRWMLFRERYHKATRQFAANNEIQIQIKIPESTPPVTADLSPASSNGKNSKKVTSPPNKTSSFLDNWLVKVQKPSKTTTTILKELRIMLSRMPLTPELEEYLASQRKIKSELEEEVSYIKIEPKNEPVDDTEELLETRNHLIGALKEYTSTKQLRSAPIKNLQSGLPQLKSSPIKKILIKPKQTLKLKSVLIKNRKKSIESTMETSEEITLPTMRYKPGPKSKRISEQAEQISKQITETASNERVSTQDETVTSNEVRTSIIRKPCPKSKQSSVETEVGTQILRTSGPEFSSGTEENTSIIRKPCPKSKQIPMRTETEISVLHKPCPKSKKICLKTEENTSVIRKPCPKSKQTPVQTEECSPVIQESCSKSKQIAVETQVDTPVILKPCTKSKQISSDSNVRSPIARTPCPKLKHVPEQNETSVTVAELVRMLSKPMPGSKRQVIEAQLKALKTTSSSPTSSVMTTSSDSDDLMEVDTSRSNKPMGHKQLSIMSFMSNKPQSTSNATPIQSEMKKEKSLETSSSSNKKRKRYYSDFDDDNMALPVAMTTCVICRATVPSSQLSKHPCFLGQKP